LIEHLNYAQHGEEIYFMLDGKFVLDFTKEYANLGFTDNFIQFIYLKRNYFIYK